MKSTFARQFYLTTGMILFSFILLGSVFFSLINSYMLKEKRNSLLANAMEVSELASAYGSTGKLTDNWDFRVFLSFAAKVSALDSVICDTDGEVIICSEQQIRCKHIGFVIPPHITDYVRNHDEYYAFGTLGSLYQESKYYLGLPIVSASTGEIIGYVFTSSSAEDISLFLSRLVSIFLLTASLALFFSFVATVFIARSQSRPLREMADASKRFARGDFSTRVRISGRQDEIGALSVAFNNMAQSLEASESMRREFIANISHELKTPMTTIAGFVDGVLDGTIPPEKQERYLGIVSIEVRRLSRLVRRMLELSKYQSRESGLRLERFDMSELVGRVLISFEQKAISKDLEVELNLPDQPLYVAAEYDSITQVMYNLTDNAVKFSRPGGQLAVSLEKKGGKVVCSISNYGDTISPGELSIIFDRFHKTDRSRSEDREGVGLGLYIVKTILSRHGEDIFVTSENGLTTFRFTLTSADKKSDSKKFQPPQ